MKVTDKILLKDSVINVVNARITDDLGLIDFFNRAKHLCVKWFPEEDYDMAVSSM